jgi:hypothetical protein
MRRDTHASRLDKDRDLETGSSPARQTLFFDPWPEPKKVNSFEK